MLRARDSSIDFIKGCCIVAMVLGHSWMSLAPDQFVNLFHMSCFFMAAGYFFDCKKCKTVGSLKKFILSKVKRLYFPWALWTLVFLFATEFLFAIHFYTDDPQYIVLHPGRWSHLEAHRSIGYMLYGVVKAVFMIGSNSLTGQLWFLQVLFHIYLWYSLMSFLLNKLRCNWFAVQSAISTLFLFCGRLMHGGAFKIVSGERLFICYALFHLGVVLCRFAPNCLKSRCGNLFVSFASFITLTTLYCCGVRIGIMQNHYQNGVLVLFAALSGWFMLRHAACVFDGKIHSVVVYIGAHTMPILIFHWVAFRAVNAVVVHLQGLPKCLIASFPTLYIGWGWCLVYVIAGVGIPLLVATAWQYSKTSFLMKKECYGGK